MSARTKIEKLEELVKECIVGEIVEQRLESLVPPGENFGSVIYKVDFKVRNGEEIKTYHAVAKCTPPNEVTQEFFNINVTTKAEIAWYTTVIPTFKDYQREHGVEQVADFFQKFYGSRISLDPSSDIVDIDAVILTENLKPLGYGNIDRHVGFDLKTAKAILRDLATFHAVPIAIKLKNNELFEKNIKPYLPGIQMKEDPSSNAEDFFKNFTKGLNDIPEVAPYMDRIVTNLKNKKPSDISPTVDEPWESACHNDFWINNIMVKDENNTKTIFLDFQIPKYGPIAHDVVFFLITSVALEVIKERMDELIKYYWDEFKQNLNQFNIDNPSFTYEEFLKQINKVGPNQLKQTLFHTYIILADKGRTDFDSSDENFKKEDFGKFNFTFSNRHKEKYRWVVLEFVKRDWI